MKEIKRKLLLTAVVIIFAFVATAGTTYAWFSTSQSVELKELTINVKAFKSVLIKMAHADAEFDYLGYSSNLVPSSYLQIITKDYFDYDPSDPEDIDYGYRLHAWNLSPVTVITDTYASVNGNIFNKFTVPDFADYSRSLSQINQYRYVGTFDSDTETWSIGNDGEINTPHGGVIQIKLWVMSQAAGTIPLYFSDLSISTTGPRYLVESVHGAARVSTLATGYLSGYYENTAQYTADAATLTGAQLSSRIIDNRGTFSADNAQFGYRNSNPLVFANDDLLVDPDGIDNNGDEYTVKGLDYDFEFKPGTVGYDPSKTFNKLANADVLASLPNTYGVVADPGTAITILHQNEPQLLTFTLFIEGWDKEANNNIISSQMTLDFSLKIEYDD
ncbi:MAG: hypothetical protein GX904_04815 [Acholeplasmataceae bacterium]|nr:hypothetical protein [Acholeplasmataceae bacterium]